MEIPHRCINTPRPIKVICIGAGISGILTAIQLTSVVSDLELVIYDKNAGIGGTWFENRYPGIACDIPSHCYQLSFEGYPGWSTYYAAGSEILQYWEAICKKYDVYKHVRLEHEITEARWNQTDSLWTVKGRDETGTTFTDSANFLISAAGLLNKWDWPKINGLHDFQGQLMHSANWKEDFSVSGKRVAVIGAGSSGIQIVPKIQPKVSRLSHFVRGKTWITVPIGGNMVQEHAPEKGNFEFSNAQIQKWIDDPEEYYKFRKVLEQELQSGHPITIKDSDAQKGARELFIQLMKQRLHKKPEIADQLIPNFPPLCKRFTPGPGYLEALGADNVDVIMSPIEKVTPTGIQSTDGKFHDVDVIICATGFDTSFHHRFPVFGVDDINLNEKWQDVPDSYLGIATDKFPNYFIYLGPNSAQGAGNLLMLMERTATYIGQVIRKMQLENIQTITPKASCVKNFTSFCDKYFQGTVFSEECSSWYKTGGNKGRVSALWPGSSLHAIQALDKPRWEDYDYTYVDGNEFSWFGDGWAVTDRANADRAFYIQPDQLLYGALATRGGKPSNS